MQMKMPLRYPTSLTAMVASGERQTSQILYILIISSTNDFVNSFVTDKFRK